jgi:hypothetical protein
VRTSVAQTHWTRRDFARAVEADLDSPSYVSILSVEGMGRTSEAIVLVNEALRRPTVPEMARVFLSAWRLRTNFFDPEGIYRLGWMLARLREDAFALELLRRAVTSGFACPFHMSADPWFEGLREGREFNQILALAQEKQAGARAAFIALRGDELLQVSRAGRATHAKR